MNRFSDNLRKRILHSYLRESGKVIRLLKSKEHPYYHSSNLEIHAFKGEVWFLSQPFYIVHMGVKHEIPSGFCVCFEQELNLFSRIILGKKYPKPVIALVWFRDVLNYEVKDLKIVLESILKDEGIAKLARGILFLSLRMK